MVPEKLRLIWGIFFTEMLTLDLSTPVYGYWIDHPGAWHSFYK